MRPRVRHSGRLSERLCAVLPGSYLHQLVAALIVCLSLVSLRASGECWQAEGERNRNEPRPL